MPSLRVRDAVQIQGLYLLFGFAIAALFPFLALYLRDAHHLSEEQIGIVIMVAGIARTVANPLWGHYADTRLGRVRALQIALAGAAAAALWLGVANGFTMAAAAAAALFFFMVGQGSSLDAIMLEHLGDERMDEVGRIRAWESVTYATGCLGFGAVLQGFGMGWAMPMYALSLVAALAWSTTLPRDRGRPLADAGRFGAVGAVFREAPRFWGFLVAVFLVWTGFNAAWNFIGLKINDAGGGALLVGIGTALGGVMEVLTMRASSRLHRRLGLRKVYVIGCLVYAGGFALWGAVTNATVLSFLTLFEGVAFSLLFTTGIVVVGRLLPSTLYATGSAVSGMVGFGLGPIVGAFLGGVAYQHFGAVYTYAGASVLALAGGVVAWFALATPELSRPLTTVIPPVFPEGPLP